MHAVEQFKLRGGGGNKWDEARFAKHIFAMVDSGHPMRVKASHRMIQMLNHGVREAEYYRYGEWLLVVEDKCVKTIHKGTADRWEPIT